MFNSSLNRFRLISYIEGFSYLILVFFAMPLKYLFDNPIYVKVLGMAHGVLFILFVILLIDVMRKMSWKIRFTAEIFILSLIPFGLFIIEKRVKNSKI